MVLAGSMLAAAGISGCRDSDLSTGILDQGIFDVQVAGRANLTYRGTASFTSSFEDGAEILTISLTMEGGAFELTFSIRDFRGEPEVFDVTVGSEQYSGQFSYAHEGERIYYDIDFGSLTIEGVSKYLIDGELNLRGTAGEGGEAGEQASVTGYFRAACEGDCLGGGGPPPGS